MLVYRLTERSESDYDVARADIRAVDDLIPLDTDKEGRVCDYSRDEVAYVRCLAARHRYTDAVLAEQLAEISIAVDHGFDAIAAYAVCVAPDRIRQHEAVGRAYAQKVV